MASQSLTLNEIKNSPREVRIGLSDLLTKEQLNEHRQAVAKSKKVSTKRFDEIDSESAEILARFGFGAWQAWQNGTISIEQMRRYIFAERARESRNQLRWLATVVASVAGANHAVKGKKTPAGLRIAQKNLELLDKRAKEGV